MCSEHAASPEYLITLLQPGQIMNEKWKLISLIGTGSFGVVYKVEGVKDKQIYAMKAELSNPEHLVLKIEAHVLRKMQKSRHVCRYYDNDFDGKIHYLVMSLVGKNLGDLRKKVLGKHFSLGTTLWLGIECLEAIQELHQAGFIHRDIKPSNFGIGATPETKRNIYLLDFGIVRQYIVKGRVRQPRSSVKYGGTARYSSMSAHYGRELFTYDDVISLFLSMAEMYRGDLPWKLSDTIQETLRIKNRVGIDDIFGDMPEEFKKIYRFLQTRRYGDLVDYATYRTKFQEMLEQTKIRKEDIFEWEDEKEEPEASISSKEED